MQDAVGEARLIRAVGDPDAGEAALADESKYEVFDGLAVGGVEGGGRFVEEQQFGLVGERPQNGNALGFSAGERGGVAGGKTWKANFFEHGLHGFGGKMDALLPGAEGDVAGDCAGEEIGVLHDQTDAAAEFGGRKGARVFAVEADVAGGGFFEAVEQAQEGALSGSAGTRDGEDFSGGDAEVDVLENGARFGRRGVPRDLDAFQAWRG